jgi:DNA topoisomerase-1
MIATLKPYSSLVTELLKKSQLVPNEGKRSDPAHPAIYPTLEVSDLENLSSQQKNLYDLIIRRFLSVFGDPAFRESIKVSLDINGYKFFIVGNRSIDPGWTKIYKKYLVSKDQLLPDFRIGQSLKIITLNLLDRETLPPSRYSQGSILKAMENRNLGTRTTRAEILQTLYDRQYIEGKSIRVTKLGEVVINVLKEFCPRITNEQLTKKFEVEMTSVYDEKKKRAAVIKEAKSILMDVLTDFKKNEKEIGKRLFNGLSEARSAQRTLGLCPKCSSELKIVKSKRTTLSFVGCTGYPKCTNSYPLPQNAKIFKTGRICQKCSTPIVRVIRKGKRSFNMCLDPNCDTKKDWGKKLSKLKNRKRKN